MNETSDPLQSGSDFLGVYRPSPRRFIESMQDRVEFRRYSLPFRTPVRTAHGFWSAREGVLARIESEDGAIAYHEFAVLPWMPPLEEPLELPHPAPAPDGNPDDFIPLAALLPAGRAGVDAGRTKAEAGFRVFKWKVGVADPDQEMGQLDELLSALPTGSRLRLDANGAWDRRRAEAWLALCADRPVEFIEQPVSADDRKATDLLLGLAEDYPTPIGLDESLLGDGDIERWVGAGWRGIYVVKPTLLKFPSASLALLHKAGAKVVFSSALETRIGAKAALRFAFGWDGARLAAGFGVYPLFQDSRFDGPSAAPFVRRSDAEAMDEEAAWTALG